MRPVGRRRFLYLVASATASAGLAAPLLLRRDREEASQAISTNALQRVERTSWALGSHISITALHTDAAQAKAAVDAAFTEIELVESLMSIYREESQLSRLNRDGVLEDPHPYLLEVLRTANELSARTGGAFDITVQPLWNVYAQAQQQGELPSQSDIKAARRRIGWQRVELPPVQVLGGGQVRLRGNGTAITLNGIAQGFAADLVDETLRAHGIQHALIDTGEIGALGGKSDGDGWTIGIQHPRHPDAYLSLASLAGRCLATSGDYATTFSADFEHHHLLDPRTGRSPTELSSVSIAADSAMEADALSTAVFVLGADAGFALLQESPGVDALFVLKDGSTRFTPGFPLGV